MTQPMQAGSLIEKALDLARAGGPVSMCNEIPDPEISAQDPDFQFSSQISVASRHGNGGPPGGAEPVLDPVGLALPEF
jgi:hypothetical protein